MKPKDTICGYFLGKLERQEEEESDESELDDWLDLNDIDSYSTDGHELSSNSIKKVKVRFKKYGSKESQIVEGHFHFFDPWWGATMTVRGNRLVGTPKYFIREDSSVGIDGIVPILLEKSKVHEQHRSQFLEWVSLHHETENLNFKNLPEILSRFGSESSNNFEVMNEITNHMEKGPADVIYKWFDYGLFFKYFPVLFPKTFKHMAKKQELILKLEEAYASEPWVFGYYKVMVDKFKLYGCEASLDQYKECGLFVELTDVQQDALRLYDFIKYQCRRFGDTYLFLTKVTQSPVLRHPEISHWSDALKYLEENKVIVKESDSEAQDERIYLQYLWEAEKNIASGLGTLFRRQKDDPLCFNVNLSSELFKDFRSDREQQQAIDLISQQPVVCLSGKGGCGKTHVVSKVFKYAEEMFKQEKIRRNQEELFNEHEESGELDDFMLTQTVNIFEQTILTKNDEVSVKEESIAALREDISGLNKEVYEKLENASEPKVCSKQLSHDTSDLHSDFVLSQSMNNHDVTVGSREIGNKTLEYYDTAVTNSDLKEESFPVILLTAPTGKAANLLGKRAQLPSNTLHQVIFNYRRWRFSKTNLKWKYCKVQVLVVDECSLVSVRIFSTLLQMLLENACLRKLVLLGDINQLPSIEPGNFLSDIYHSLSTRGLSKILKTNHRSEGKLIISNASLIASRRMPLFNSEEFEFCAIDEALPEIRADDITCDRDQKVCKLLDTEESLKDHKVSQFVAFRRNDCVAINEICSKFYCQHSCKTERNQLDFQIGDKICCTKNADIWDFISCKNLRFCNGEIFFVKGDRIVENDPVAGESTRYLTLGEEEDQQEKYMEFDFKDLKRLCKIKHAWARTIHTFQGSEAGTVVYVVGSPGIQNWQHVYTAITRGRTKVIILSRRSHLEAAVKNRPWKRNTSLKERMKKLMKSVQGDIFPLHRVNNSEFSLNITSNQNSVTEAEKRFLSPLRVEKPMNETKLLSMKGGDSFSLVKDEAIGENSEIGEKVKDTSKIHEYGQMKPEDSHITNFARVSKAKKNLDMYFKACSKHSYNCECVKSERPVLNNEYTGIKSFSKKEQNINVDNGGYDEKYDDISDDYLNQLLDMCSDEISHETKGSSINDTVATSQCISPNIQLNSPKRRFSIGDIKDVGKDATKVMRVSSNPDISPLRRMLDKSCLKSPASDTD